MGRTFSRKGEFLVHFKQFLKEARAQNKKVLLIIDEAQQITSELLEEVRLLSNLEDEYVRLLNIFFVGQNEFIDILNKYKNRALTQRIGISYYLEPLTLSETETYIRHRLKISGAKAPIFTPGAIQEIFSFSNGYPRMINIISDHALLTGYVREITIVNKDIIRECKEELKISHTRLNRHANNFENESGSKRKFDVLQKEERLKYIHIPTSFVVTGIALLAVIGSLTGYVCYNNIRANTVHCPNFIFSQGKTSCAGQEEVRKRENGEVSNIRNHLVRAPELKLFKEKITNKEKAFP
jgi:hypothetical protein